MLQAVICTCRWSYCPRVCRITKIMWFSLSPVSGPFCLGGPEAWPQSHGLDSVLQKWKRSDWTPRTSDWREPGRTKETQQQRWLLDLHPRWVCLRVCVVCHNKALCSIQAPDWWSEPAELDTLLSSSCIGVLSVIMGAPITFCQQLVCEGDT